MLRDLAKSPLASGASTHAQELALLGEKNPNSIVANIKSVLDARVKAAEGKLKQPVAQAVKREVAAIKSQAKPPTKMDWHQFVESIKC